ncbi:MAG: hypothetical protein ACOY93_09165, partial [Bacillota bacterium]
MVPLRGTPSARDRRVQLRGARRPGLVGPACGGARRPGRRSFLGAEEFGLRWERGRLKIEMEMQAAQALLKALELEGVEVIFGYPGGA